MAFCLGRNEAGGEAPNLLSTSQPADTSYVEAYVQSQNIVSKKEEVKYPNGGIDELGLYIERLSCGTILFLKARRGGARWRPDRRRTKRLGASPLGLRQKKKAAPYHCARGLDLRSCQAAETAM